jgi:hypothetical protein
MNYDIMMNDAQINNLIALLALLFTIYNSLIVSHQSYKNRHFESSCCGHDVMEFGTDKTQFDKP